MEDSKLKDAASKALQALRDLSPLTNVEHIRAKNELAAALNLETRLTAKQRQTTKFYRFYAEMPEPWRSKSANKEHEAFTRKTLTAWAARGLTANCVAVLLDEKTGRPMTGGSGSYECASACYFHNNSACAGSSVSGEYLRERCVRVSADLARKLHPALFQYLEV